MGDGARVGLNPDRPDQTMTRRSAIFFSSLLTALLLTVLPGCERMDRPASEENAILFRAGMVGGSSVSTKGTVDNAYPSHESDFIKAGNTISVYGSWTSPTGTTTDIFRGVELTCEETADVLEPFQWTYAPLRYWRSEGTYNFGSVYPTNARVEYGTSGGKLVATYSMLADDYDLMVASTKRNMDEIGSTASVPLVFHHACAAVRFLFRKAEGSETDYFIDSFELQNLSAVGRLVANWVVTNNPQPGDEEYQISWTPAEAKSSGISAWQAASQADWIEVPENYAVHPETPEEIEKWHFVIPQQLLGDGITHPTLRFSIHVGNDATPVYTRLQLPEEQEDPNTNNLVPIRWEPGKLYTYKVQIQPSKAFIEVEVKPWDEYYLGVDDIAF